MNPNTIFVLLALATGTHAAVTLTATEDNYVSKNAASTVQDGSATSLLLKNSVLAEPNVRFGYFKFNIAGVTTAEGTGATFTITLNGSSSTSTFVLNAFALNAGIAGFDWSESGGPVGTANASEGITWNNRPALSTTDANNVDLTKVTEFSNTVSIGTSTGAGTSYTFSLANWDDYRQSDDTLTVILLASQQTATGNTLSIATSENGTAIRRPTLTIPEPSSAALLVLGGLFLIRRKR